MNCNTVNQNLILTEKGHIMLELTGSCCSGTEAIEFMEMLPDVIDDD